MSHGSKIRTVLCKQVPQQQPPTRPGSHATPSAERPRVSLVRSPVLECHEDNERVHALRGAHREVRGELAASRLNLLARAIAGMHETGSSQAAADGEKRRAT